MSFIFQFNSNVHHSFPVGAYFRIVESVGKEQVKILFHTKTMYLINLFNLFFGEFYENAI